MADYPNILNFALFQLVWWSAVGGAREGVDWAGPAVFLLLLPLHLYFSGEVKRELRIVAAAGLLGLLLDSLQRNWGWVDFATQGSPTWLSPWWIVALWMNFAIVVNHTLRWFHGRYFWAALIGAVGGPVSYWAGARLGVVYFPDGLGLGLGSVALEWALAVPLLFKFNSYSQAPKPNQ